MYSNKIAEQQTTVALVVEALFALCTGSVNYNGRPSTKFQPKCSLGRLPNPVMTLWPSVRLFKQQIKIK